ncbi:MAG: hypothetical protein MJ092_06110, partial [Lachnospiraceae bacterium]|nr:hypothetical protein [Lachnospiraceae bacterium]
MPHQTELKKIQNRIIKNGIAHIEYSVNDIHDVIHPFSVSGNEVLSDDFLAFMEKYVPLIPQKTPVVLHITGKTFSTEEKQLIDNTIWSSYCMNMTSADIEAKSCVKRVILFLLYMLISVILLFAVQNIKDELILNIAYIPFWFFGYRMLIYLIMDCLPLWKSRNRFRQFASMKIDFTAEGDAIVENDSPLETAKAVEGYIRETNNELNNNQILLHYIQRKGLMELVCSVSSLDDVIKASKIQSEEYLSAQMASYLGQVEMFFSTNCQLMFKIQGKEFKEEEQARIKQAIKNYYSSRLASVENEAHENRQKIILFLLFAFISAVVILLWGASVDVAQHEFLIMLLWFF